MKIKLKMNSRLVLAGILPAQADYVTITLATDLRKLLIPGEEEIKKISFKIETTDKGETSYHWNKEKDSEMEVDIHEILVTAIKKKLTELNKGKKLTEQHIEFYKKFDMDKEGDKDGQPTK